MPGHCLQASSSTTHPQGEGASPDSPAMVRGDTTSVLSESCTSSFSLVLCYIVREYARYHKEALRNRVNIEWGSTAGTLQSCCSCVDDVLMPFISSRCFPLKHKVMFLLMCSLQWPRVCTSFGLNRLRHSREAANCFLLVPEPGPNRSLFRSHIEAGGKEHCPCHELMPVRQDGTEVSHQQAESLSSHL